MEAHVNGASTRKVDRLVGQLGIHGMSKGRVSSLCRELDERVEAFRTRLLEGLYPYLWLDAKHLKIRDGGRSIVVRERRRPRPTRGSSELAEDLERQVGRAAALDELERTVKIDVRPMGKLARSVLAVPGSCELVKSPARNLRLRCGGFATTPIEFPCCHVYP